MLATARAIRMDVEISGSGGVLRPGPTCVPLGAPEHSLMHSAAHDCQHSSIRLRVTPLASLLEHMRLQRSTQAVRAIVCC